MSVAAKTEKGEVMYDVARLMRKVATESLFALLFWTCALALIAAIWIWGY